MTGPSGMKNADTDGVRSPTKTSKAGTAPVMSFPMNRNTAFRTTRTPTRTMLVVMYSIALQEAGTKLLPVNPTKMYAILFTNFRQHSMHHKQHRTQQAIIFTSGLFSCFATTRM